MTIVDKTEATLADDLLFGAEAINAFLGNRSYRQTFHWLEKGYIPARKIGNLWIGSKSRLRSYLCDVPHQPPTMGKTGPTPIQPGQPKRKWQVS